jgi:lipoate-protein ligase A
LTAWHPDIYALDANDVAENVAEAIKNEKDCIFMCKGEGIHAFHGNDEINLELCEQLGVKVVELNYRGGTIIGSKEDLSMLIIFPKEIGMREQDVTSKFLEAIGPEASYDDNDIMLNGKKIAGITWREFKNISVYTIQVSFKDYTEYINQICKKEAKKIPGYIDSEIITRDELENSIISWLIS